MLKRNGVPIGHPGALRNMLYRSLGAKNFGVFWQYWNPIFGYCLGRYVFRPAKQHLPPGPALVFTFVFCGLLHDLVVLAIRWRPSYFFMIWFMFMAIGVLIARWFKHDLSALPWLLRAVYNLSYIGLTFYTATYVDYAFRIMF
ncbi:hypothetical protein MQE36_07435 [Zhouia spongiae]|uniref:Acyltransferase n=1 Tax=Zhouia spongiae TaxID=2202721 RepID=A0ABY3YR32_9FLAO|nr:hypothetical protein [Zhouia spongiae]UNZ00167.1 hypothetical protein MQE36_07435 [Zhouia spongiae]